MNHPDRDELFERELFTRRARAVDARAPAPLPAEAFFVDALAAKPSARAPRPTSELRRTLHTALSLAAAACLLARAGAFAPSAARPTDASGAAAAPLAWSSGPELGVSAPGAAADPSDPLTCSAGGGPACVAAFASPEGAEAWAPARGVGVAACVAPASACAAPERVQ